MVDDAFTSRLEITYGPAELVDPVGSVGFAGGLGAETGPPVSLDLHPILRDFAHSTDSASHQAWLTGLTWTAHLRDSMVTVTGSVPDGSSFGFGIPDGPAASRLAAAADRLQDFVVEHLRIGLPPVPGTARTAHALLHDGEALWADDRTPWSCLIGSYL